MLPNNPIYVVGAAETRLGIVPDQSEFSMVAEATLAALDEAGLGLKDVDGLFSTYMGDESTVQVGEYLGIEPRYADSTDLGGASFEAYVHHAMLAITAGRCNVALIAYASRQRSRRLRTAGAPAVPPTLHTEWEAPYGLPAALGEMALVASRHAHLYGTTPEQSAEVAVAARRWAQLNPVAWCREPLTVEQVCASPMFASPIRNLECCLITDGGGAVVLAGEAHARGARKRPVRVIGASESHGCWNVSQNPDITRTAAVRSGADAFAMAGITVDDVDFLQPYDATTWTVLLALEDLGFCAKGEAGAFVEGGRLGPGGDLPAMTSGGGLSYCHPGALGLLLLIEAVRQLRGEAGERQVDDAGIGVVHGYGGLWSASSTVVLARD